LLGLILVLGALVGDSAERAKIPWITGCIVVGVVLGPAATGLLQGSNGTPDWESRLTAMVLGLILVSIGSAITHFALIG
jgi:Kef-type K+ transport system membrane component KefB